MRICKTLNTREAHDAAAQLVARGANGNPLVPQTLSDKLLSSLDNTLDSFLNDNSNAVFWQDEDISLACASQQGVNDAPAKKETVVEPPDSHRSTASTVASNQTDWLDTNATAVMSPAPCYTETSQMTLGHATNFTGVLSSMLHAPDPRKSDDWSYWELFQNGQGFENDDISFWPDRVTQPGPI